MLSRDPQHAQSLPPTQDDGSPEGILVDPWHSETNITKTLPVIRSSFSKKAYNFHKKKYKFPNHRKRRHSSGYNTLSNDSGETPEKDRTLLQEIKSAKQCSVSDSWSVPSAVEILSKVSTQHNSLGDFVGKTVTVKHGSMVKSALHSEDVSSATFSEALRGETTTQQRNPLHNEKSYKRQPGETENEVESPKTTRTNSTTRSSSTRSTTEENLSLFVNVSQSFAPVTPKRKHCSSVSSVPPSLVEATGKLSPVSSIADECGQINEEEEEDAPSPVASAIHPSLTPDVGDEPSKRELSTKQDAPSSVASAIHPSLTPSLSKPPNIPTDRELSTSAYPPGICVPYNTGSYDTWVAMQIQHMQSRMQWMLNQKDQERHQLQQQLEKLSKELVALRFQNVVLQKSIIRRDEKNKLRLEKLKKAENTQQ